MRILLTAHQFLPKHSSGTEVLTRDTGLEMLARGHEVHVLTVDPGARGGAIDVSYEDYDHRGLKVHALGLPRRKLPVEVIRDEYDNDLIAEHVRRYVRQIQPDAVHMFHLSRLSGSVIEVFRELGVPVVFTPTDFWAICVRNTLAKPSGELSTGPDEISANCLECRGVERFLPSEELPDDADKQKFYRKIAERALAKPKDEHPNMALVRPMLARTEFLRNRFNGVDAILAPTKLVNRMFTTNGIDPGLMTLSPYGMNTSGFRDAKRPRPESGELRVGYIGTIHPQKGLRVLLEAFKKLPKDNEATLRICGSLEWYPDYAREVYELAGGDPRINFAGSFPNEKMVEELGKIDVLVVPSTWYENTPLVIYSAFAAGIPVVATNLGGMAEVVHHEKNGLLFEPGDPEDLARQLKRLIGEPGLLEELGNNPGSVRTVEDSVDEMLDLYERLREKKAKEKERAQSASRSTEEWLWLNYEGIKENPGLREFVAPFPPAGLRALMGGLPELEFARHGVELYKSLLEASPVPWEQLKVILDHGCGSGRVARLFKGQGKELHGVDIDRRYIAWFHKALPYVKAAAIEPNEPLPYADDTFDAIYQISVLTHLNEEYHKGLLAELARVSKPGAILLLSVHAERALERARTDDRIWNALNVAEEPFREAAAKFEKGGHAFIEQKSYKTTEDFKYGVSFIPASYIRDNWEEWFEILDIRRGAVMDFHDLVVLRAKAGKPRIETPDSSTRSSASKVSEHWARNVEARQSGSFAGNWLDHGAILRLYINPMSTGSPDEKWFDYVARKHFPEPVEKALSLGCGGGGLERHGLSLDICESFDAYDISEGSVEAAREEARKAGFLDRVNYAVADLNNISLEENAYDAVFASMSIHHLDNLEGVFSELNKALKPGGLFVFNEFVGPSQFQWTEEQLALSNELLASIPEQYRISENGNVYREVKRPTLQHMNEIDPSESIRSAEIMPLLERYFDIVERRDYGGTLLHLVTSAGTTRNYSPEREEDVELLQRMIDFEKQHIAAGDIDSDFTLVIARNPGNEADRDRGGSD